MSVRLVCWPEMLHSVSPWRISQSSTAGCCMYLLLFRNVGCLPISKLPSRGNTASLDALCEIPFQSWLPLFSGCATIRVLMAKESALKRLRIWKADDSYRSVGVFFLLLR